MSTSSGLPSPSLSSPETEDEALALDSLRLFQKTSTGWSTASPPPSLSPASQDLPVGQQPPSLYLNCARPKVFCFQLRRLQAIVRLRFHGLLRKPGTHPWLGQPRRFVTVTADNCLSEATTIRFVKENTIAVPVPEVILAFAYAGHSYTFLRYPKGDSLLSAWGLMTPDERTRVQEQLRGAQADMRSLRPGPGRQDEGVVANVGGGPLRTRAAPGKGQRVFGPFKTTTEFHRWVTRSDIRESFGSGVVDEAARCITRQDGRGRTVFTHGAFTARNILVRNGNVVAVVGWEAAGWYPTYWECLEARRLNARDSIEQTQLNRFIDREP